MLRASSIICLALLLFMAFGCKQPVLQTLDPVYRADHNGPIGQNGTVTKGGTMLTMTKGEYFEVMKLKNRVTGSFMTVSCNVAPQTYGNIRVDKEFYYMTSGKDLARDPMPNAALDGWPCGLKINQKNFMDTRVIVDTSTPGCADCGAYELDLDDGVVPDVEMATMVNIYAPDFLRKTLKFESYADGYLSLYLLEEKGKPNGFTADGKEVLTDPVMTEEVVSFDLNESKTIQVAGATIEVKSASPNELVYTVIKSMNEN